MEKGADVECQDGLEGKRPLHFACYNGREKIVKILLKKGAEANVRDNYDGKTPLQFAPSNDNIVKMLLEEGANLEI